MIGRHELYMHRAAAGIRDKRTTSCLILIFEWRASL